MSWQERISSSPDICGGQVCIAGTRIPVSVVLDNLVDGLTPLEIVRSYPTLTVDDVRAALAYAADVTHERVLPLRRTA